jgi:hypothetical protein
MKLILIVRINESLFDMKKKLEQWDLELRQFYRIVLQNLQATSKISLSKIKVQILSILVSLQLF